MMYATITLSTDIEVDDESYKVVTLAEVFSNGTDYLWGTEITTKDRPIPSQALAALSRKVAAVRRLHVSKLNLHMEEEKENK